MIEALTVPGDVVLDPFAGGGTTIYESAKLGRAAIGCDINPLSNFIVRNMLVTSDAKALKTASEEITRYIEEITDLELPNCSQCSSPMECEWAELQHVCSCPDCGTRIPLSEKNKMRPGVYACSNQNCFAAIEGFRTARTARLMPVYKSLVLKCTHCAHKAELTVDDQTTDLIRGNVESLRGLVEDRNIAVDQTTIPRNWDRQKEDLLYEKGFIRFADLFTERNFLTNSLLKNYIITKYGNSETYESLRFILSDSLRDTNSMSFTSKSWQSGKPTTWSKHAYWLPNEFCEMSVSKAFWTSYKALAGSHLFNQKHKFRGKLVAALPTHRGLGPGEVFLHSGPIETLNLAPNSVDAVITDPPYGSNVQYLELSHFWHPWNKDLYHNPNPDSKSEAVVNRKDGFAGAKGYSEYEENLYRVFASSFQALRPGGSLALTFNNKDLRAWVALIMSILRSGFRYTPASIVFQDGVHNYKQTAHTRFAGSPFGDFVYVFSKPTAASAATTWTRKLGPSELSGDINELTEKALGLLSSGLNREKVLTKYFDKLVQAIQVFYDSGHTDADGLYATISRGKLGDFYTEGKK